MASDPRKNKKLLALIVVFAALLLVLGIMAGKMMFGNQKPARVPPKASDNGALAPANEQMGPTTNEIDAPQKEASGSAVDYASLKLQVINSSGTSGLAATIKSGLGKEGFRNIDVGNGPTLNGAKNQISFDSKISGEVQQQLLAMMDKVLGETSVSSGSQTKYDVVITLVRTAESSQSAKNRL